jgi:addiction module HigA family antidote
MFMRRGKNQLKPDYAVLPGDTLKETLDALGMSQADLAERTGRPVKTINEIIQGKAALTPETALQLEKVLSIPASFWNNLEQNYQESLTAL